MDQSRRRIFLGIAALATAFAATAATIPSPYRPTASASAAAALAAEGQEGLDLDARALAALRTGGKVLEVDGFPLAPGASGKLRLTRFEVATPDAKMTIQGPDGETAFPLPSVTHYSGVVEGETDSSVYLGLADDGLVAYVHSSQGHAYVGPNENRSAFVVRMGDSPLNARAANAPWSCAQEALPQHVALATPESATPTAPTVAGFKDALVRVETDHQLYQFFGSDPGALTVYVLRLFGAINVIYDRDLAMHLSVNEIHMWSSADPYTGGDTLTQLYQLGTWWHGNKPMASNPRTMVHYLSGHPVTGGIAWLAVLCAADFDAGSGNWGGAYGLTQVNGTYPLSLWDQDASAHEMGHNAGSPHTHCMGPPTYPDWTDECYNGESGCYSGPVQNPGPGGGTIMSYCHLLGWQYMSFVFHPRCINDKMLPEINGASCLTSPATFVDVPTTDPFFHWVETVYQTHITGGCSTSPLMYCPTAPVTRQQMAVFLMKSIHGYAYVPPACTGLFADVPCSSSYAGWIEELANEGVTSGCGGGNYCPTDPVTRQQMAVFLLKAEHNPAWTPPACTSNPFADVACPSTYANWIEQLVAEGITGGCGGSNYCPLDPVTRAQMAVFLTKTFNLGW